MLWRNCHSDVHNSYFSNSLQTEQNSGHLLADIPRNVVVLSEAWLCKLYKRCTMPQYSVLYLKRIFLKLSSFSVIKDVSVPYSHVAGVIALSLYICSWSSCPFSKCFPTSLPKISFWFLAIALCLLYLLCL